MAITLRLEDRLLVATQPITMVVVRCQEQETWHQTKLRSTITMRGNKVRQTTEAVLGIILQMHAVHSGVTLDLTLTPDGTTQVQDKPGAILQAIGVVVCAAVVASLAESASAVVVAVM